MSDWRFIVSGSAVDPETNYGFVIQQFPGAGMAGLQNISTDFGLLDGAIFQRQRVPPSSLTLTGVINGSSKVDLHTKRRLLIDAVKPDRSASQEAVVLQYLGSGSTRQASAFFETGLELGEEEAFRERVALRFALFDPYWESTTSTSATLTTQASFTAAYIAQRAACGAWGAMGTGMNGTVLSIVSASDGTLIVGGSFTTAGGTEACRIAQWSGTAWSKLGNAFNSYVNDIAIHPTGRVYAVGAFTTASGATACRVAQWTGTAWLAVGNALNGEARTAAISETGDLWVGGDFTTASSFSACRVARWNVDRWRSAGAGVNGGNGRVHKILFDSASELYVIGDFTTASAMTACGVARFNLTDWWRGLAGSGLTANGVGLGQSGLIDQSGQLYVVGIFDAAGGVTACGIAAWNGVQYSGINQGVNSGATGIWSQYGGGFILSGAFSLAGGKIIARNKVYWDGYWIPFDIELPSQDNINAAHSASDGILTLGWGTTGTACAAAVTSVSNGGTAAAYPIVTVTAPTASAATDGEGLIRITQLVNYTSNQAIYFDLNLIAGEVVTIDLRPGKKTMSSNYRANLIGSVLPRSDFTTWRLLPGTNNVSFWLTGGSGTAKLTWTERFWSGD